MAKQKTLLPVLALIGASVLWGVNIPVIKFSIATIPVLVFLVVRMFVASMFLLPFALKNWKPLKRKHLWMMVLSSVIWIAFTSVTLNIGLKYAPSINAGVINLLAPLILCFLSVEFLKERMSFKALAGALIAFAGASIIIGKPWEVDLTGQSVLLGNVLFITSMLGTVISTLLAKPLLKHMGAYQGAFLYLFPGTLCVMPIALTQLHGWSFHDIPTSGYIAAAYGIAAVTVANLLYMYGLKYKAASSVGIFQYVESVVLFIAAWLILGEHPTPKFAIGAILVFAGLYLAEFMPTKRKKKLRLFNIKTAH